MFIKNLARRKVNNKAPKFDICKKLIRIMLQVLGYITQLMMWW